MQQIVKEIIEQFGSAQPEAPSYFDSLETYKVKKVSDADTIDVIDAAGETITVRFVYIDAPETPKGWGYKKIEDLNQENPFYQTQFKWGNQGKERLKELVEQGGNEVKLRILEADTRYNRQIAEVYLTDGTLTQYILIREGLAKIYYDYLNKCPRDMALVLMIAEEAAENEGRGLWQEKKSEFMSPWLFRIMKRIQKKLIEDTETHTHLVEQVKALCDDFEAQKMTRTDFEEQLKDKLNSY